MSVDTAPIAGAVIERDRAGAVPARKLAALDATGLLGITVPRTHGSHDPAAWKYHHVGNYLLNDVSPPNHGQI